MAQLPWMTTRNGSGGSGLFAEREPGEAPDDYVLAGLANDVVHQLADGHLVVLHPDLLQQHMLSKLLLELALDNLLAQTLRALLHVWVIHELLARLGHRALRDIAHRHPCGIGPGNL